jgi:ATP-dependent Clp protease ATP-binding subunit ClpA
MRLDRFTERSQEALQAAQTLRHAMVEPEHRLLALLERPDGLAAYRDREADLPRVF